MVSGSGEGVITAKGGSRQRIYLCDQQNQGCKARVHWVKQAIDEWKVSRLDGEHENRQQEYLCDQQNQGCKARVHWVKQATDEWKVSRLDGEHENCGRALRRQQGENRFASVKIFITIHQPKSFLSP